MVFQAPILLKWRTILENVLLPVELAGKDPGALRKRAFDLLETAGLHGFADKLPRELSGGMQQRASLCLALLLDPPLLLMDEPFGALDAMTRDDMALELLRIWGERDLAREARKTVLFVTHSIPEAVFLRIVWSQCRPAPPRPHRGGPQDRPAAAPHRGTAPPRPSAASTWRFSGRLQEGRLARLPPADKARRKLPGAANGHRRRQSGIRLNYIAISMTYVFVGSFQLARQVFHDLVPGRA